MSVAAMTWRPLSNRGSEEDAEAYDALHDGIPEWLVQSLVDWISQVFVATCNTDDLNARLVYDYDTNEARRRNLLQLIERELRLRFKWSHGSVDTATNDMLQQCFREPKVGLDVLDLLVNRLSRSSPRYKQLIDQLDLHLHQGGSKYCVSANRDGLESRVAPTVADRAAKLMTGKTRTAAHLREAWRDVYGRNPKPGNAYGEAVRAVEAAGIPIISPKNDKATLGTMIRDMKAAPHKWRVTLQPALGDPVQYVIGMMELLWTAQLRHGTPDPSVPLTATPLEAEAALHIALTLIHMFEAGLIVPVK
jgi:hypothetical protein